MHETGLSYDVAEWSMKVDRAGRPCALLLASLLVQEEFYILKREGKVRRPDDCISLSGS